MPTFTVRQAGGDFSTLASALSSGGTVPGDTISIEGAWTIDDTAGAFVADNDITIQTDSDSYHNGVIDTTQNHYRLVVASVALRVNNSGCVIDGVATILDSAVGSAEAIRCQTFTGAITISNFILRSVQITSDQDGIFSSGQTITMNLENGIIYGFARGGIKTQTSGVATVEINLNCVTIWDCARDAAESDGGGITIEDNVVGVTQNINIFNSCIVDCNNAESTDYEQQGSAGILTWDINNCIDSDGSITIRDPGAVGAIQNRIATDNPSPGVGDFVIFQDITAAPFNLLLFDNAPDNDAQDAHSALSGAGLTLPILDIALDTRDRGANEIDVGADSITQPPPVEPGLPEYGQGRAAIGDPPVYGATIVRS